MELKKMCARLVLLLCFAVPALALASSVQTPSTNFVNTQTFLANGNFTVPANVTEIRLTGCGAGMSGAGGHTADPGGGGGGGAGGQCVDDYAVTVTPGAVLPIQIGAPNTAGAAGAASAAPTSAMDTTVSNLPIGTVFTILGGRPGPVAIAQGPGTVTNGGQGGGQNATNGGATTAGAGNPGNLITPRESGGNSVFSTTGAAGGGPSNNGGIAPTTAGGYGSGINRAAALNAGTIGAGGQGGPSALGGILQGGSNAVGESCPANQYGSGAGGGAATFAGGTGCPGILYVKW